MNFDRDTRVTAELAKQDRISLSVGEWIFVGEEDDFRSFIFSLKNSQWLEEENLTREHQIGDDDNSLEFPIFNQRQEWGARTCLIFSNRRSGGTLRAGVPLISGELEFRRVGTNRGLQRYIGVFKISINPTRALLHQHPNRSIISSAIGSSNEQPTYTPVDLRSIVPRPLIRSERPLDPMADNVIIDRQWMMMASPRHWNRHFESYIAETIRFLCNLTQTAFINIPETASLDFEFQINLKEVETYWEFKTTDPIEMMHRFVPVFCTLGTNPRRRIYDDVVEDYTIETNSPVLTTKLLTGVKAKLYAKTSSRLRLEITHDLRYFVGENREHVFSNPSDFLRRVLDLTESAANEANILLETVCTVLPPFPRQRSVYDLLKELLRSTANVADQDFLVSAIINNGGYRLEPNDTLRPAILNLVSNNVLRRTRPRSRSLTLSNEFMEAREILATRVSSAAED